MWELIANGLGLVGTGVSLVSGFALDKKTDVMSSSLERIENLQAQLLEQARSKQQFIHGPVSLVRNFGREPDPRAQLKTAQVLAEYSQQLQSDLNASTSRILNEVVSEMRRVIDSVRLTVSGEMHVPRKFARAIVHNPFDAGVVEFRDITEHGIWGVKEPHIVSPNLSPIWWSNPRSGKSYLGKISTAELERYGIKTTAPRYLHTVDGHVYSPEHGLYLPSYFVG